MEGTSLAPLLGGEGTWSSKVALTMYPRCPPGEPDWKDDACIHTIERSEFAFMGYSMRVDAVFDELSYRYTEWVAWNGTSLTPMWDGVHSIELYNHSQPCRKGTIFDCYENVNVVKAAPKGLVEEVLL